MNDALSVHAETGKSGRERHIDKRALQYADGSKRALRLRFFLRDGFS